MARPGPGAEWWRHAVCYQVYVRSFADSDGDGVGDLPGITARLPHLTALGVDALWVTPFYTSPQRDHGYDVADHCDVDPLFGSLADFEELLREAHARNLRVIIDLVPNHTSSAHPWFRAALAAGPGSPERDRYIFRDSDHRPVQAGPPNNWRSDFGGPAWEQVDDGQWYLHLFDRSQPDLNWRNRDVAAMFEDVLRFWLDRGVDGFRVDVAHGLVKHPDLPDQRFTAAERAAGAPETGARAGTYAHEPMWDQPEVHDVYRRWHDILASYPGDRMAVAEAWTRDAESLARYVRPDEMQQAFNFHWLVAPWSARAFEEVITATLASVPPGCTPTWVLANHDVVRPPSRYGGGVRGANRARAATMAMLALPGSAYLYQGEELGLEEVEVAREDWQDPLALRTGQPGRDGCRVPMPWAGDRPPYDFGPGAADAWIRQPDGWGPLTVAAQLEDPRSTLAFYREVLRVRRGFATTAGEDVELLDLGAEVLAFRRGELTALVNCGDQPLALPEGEVLASSTAVANVLPPDAAVWLR